MLLIQREVCRTRRNAWGSFQVRGQQDPCRRASNAGGGQLTRVRIGMCTYVHVRVSNILPICLGVHWYVSYTHEVSPSTSSQQGTPLPRAAPEDG